MAKYLTQSGGNLVEAQTEAVGGSSTYADKIPALDANGRFPLTMMPTGIGADSANITTSEALSSGDFVNVWNSSGAKVRKADASTSGKEAHGFVLAAVASGASATVYFEGSNTAVTGATPGVVYLSATVPGGSTSTPPSGTGQVVQRIGFATSATSINFQSHQPVTLA